jgi:hypothetical protein
MELKSGRIYTGNLRNGKAMGKGKIEDTKLNMIFQG